MYVFGHTAVQSVLPSPTAISMLTEIYSFGGLLAKSFEIKWSEIG
jgi:hypothetical protein